MALQGKYFFDEDGIPRAVFKRPEHIPLSGFLFDFWNAGGSLEEIFHAIQCIETGQEREWQWAGNDHHITLTPQGAHIENEFSVPRGDLLVPLADLREALLRWQALLATRPR